MFATRSTARHRFARPSLESLEQRMTPTDPFNGGGAPPPPPSAILTMQIEYDIDRFVILSGELTGSKVVSGVTIDFSGKVDATTTTDANGLYSIRVSATGLGMVEAVAVGTSAAAMQMLTDGDISLTLSGIEEPTYWEFKGTVAYNRPFTQLTVNFGGAPVSFHGGASATTDAAGKYSLVKFLNGTATDNGSVWAQAVSPWGTLSEKVYFYVQQTGT